MFNDRFGLTDAVLQGRKTVTRRIITPQPTYSEMSGINWKGYAYGIGSNNPTDAYRNFITGTEYSKSYDRYRVGEVVAIAQSYQNIGLGDDGSVAWTNKMFVKAGMMPHQIEILDVRVERLQDISDEDCIKEGISSYDTSGKNYIETVYGVDMINKFIELGKTPVEAYADLINRINGKGTWESNPYVFRYEFKIK